MRYLLKTWLKTSFSTTLSSKVLPNQHQKPYTHQTRIVLGFENPQKQNKTKTHTHTHTIECLVPSLAMSFYWVNRWIHMPKTGNTEIVAGIAGHNSVMKTTVTESWQNARTLWVITLPRYLGAFLPTARAISTKPHLAYYILKKKD